MVDAADTGVVDPMALTVRPPPPSPADEDQRQPHESSDESSEVLLSPPSDDGVGDIISLDTTDNDDPCDHWPARNYVHVRDRYDDPCDHWPARNYVDVRDRYHLNCHFDRPVYSVNGYLKWNSYIFCELQPDDLDSLETDSGYVDTACCSTKLDSEKNDYAMGASLCNPEKWICFLNCILQCVVHTVPLVSKLLKDDHMGPCDFDEFCCYCSLKLHAGEVIKLSGSVLYPKKFVELLELILPDFVWGQHQDAHELLCCLLDKLDEASVIPWSPSETPSSIVKDVFGGRLRSQLHCPECNHRSDTFETLFDLNLEIVEVDTVMDALHSFTKVEVLEDFRCDECKSRVKMEKHLKVDQAPEVLVIQLKRFRNLGRHTSKIQAMVRYQLELDLKPFMSSPDTEPQKYDLYGVVEHFGITSKGHYVSYIRSSQTDWFLFDDATVTKCSEASVLDSKAYLLFYVKQGSSLWFSEFLNLTQQNMLLPDPSEGSNKVVFESESEVESESDNGELVFGFRNRTVPSFGWDLSEQLQGNADGSLVGVMSGGIKEARCIPGSSACNGCVGSPVVLLENKEDVSPQGSHNIHESSQVTDGPPQVGSPQKDGIVCSSLEPSSHEDEEDSSRENSSLLNEQNGNSGLRTVAFSSDLECGEEDPSISNGKCNQL